LLTLLNEGKASVTFLVSTGLLCNRGKPETVLDTLRVEECAITLDEELGVNGVEVVVDLLLLGTVNSGRFRAIEIFCCGIEYDGVGD
jgi:hypothetical protein